MDLSKALSILLSLLLLLGCTKTTPAEEAKSPAQEKLLDFLRNEIGDRTLPGETLTDPNAIVAKYGTDFVEATEEVNPSNFEGGRMVKLRTLKYRDLEHLFYVFEDGKQLYAFLFVKHNTDSLRTVRIGGTKEEVVSAFGPDFFEYADSLISYNFGYGELQFHFSGKLLDQINVSYLMI